MANLLLKAAAYTTTNSAITDTSMPTLAVLDNDLEPRAQDVGVEDWDTFVTVEKPLTISERPGPAPVHLPVTLQPLGFSPDASRSAISWQKKCHLFRVIEFVRKIDVEWRYATLMQDAQALYNTYFSLECIPVTGLDEMGSMFQKLHLAWLELMEKKT